MSRRARTRIARAAILPALLIAAGLVARGADLPGGFTVGVLRRDALIVPVATFTGQKWRADRQIGLRSDYRSTDVLPPPETRPYPKDGLAVSPPYPVEPIEVIATGRPERAILAAAVEETFNRIERELATRSDHPVRRQADRERHAPVIEALYGYGTNPRVVYVQAAREYADADDPRRAGRWRSAGSAPRIAHTGWRNFPGGTANNTKYSRSNRRLLSASSAVRAEAADMRRLPI